MEYPPNVISLEIYKQQGIKYLMAKKLQEQVIVEPVEGNVIPFPKKPEPITA